MYLERPDAGGVAARSRLSPLPGKTDSVVTAEVPCWSPWRVVLLADRAGQLIESNLSVPERSAQQRFCLGQTGKDHVSLVEWYGRAWAGFHAGSEFRHAQEVHRFLRKANKIAYHSVITVPGGRPWYVQSGEPGYDPRPDTDILTPPPTSTCRGYLRTQKRRMALQLGLLEAAQRKARRGVHATYERWGIKGLMVDYMDRDDRGRMARAGAAIGSAPPSCTFNFMGRTDRGEQRTYPNLFNREGVLNQEYLKWSDLCRTAA